MSINLNVCDNWQWKSSGIHAVKMLHVSSSPQPPHCLDVWNWWDWCYHWDKENCICFPSSKLGLKTLEITGYCFVHIRFCKYIVCGWAEWQVHKLSQSIFPQPHIPFENIFTSSSGCLLSEAHITTARSDVLSLIRQLAHFTWDCGNIEAAV